MTVSNSVSSAADSCPAKIFSSKGRSEPDALLITWRNFTYSPCTSLTTCTVIFGNVRIASRFASSASACSTVGYCFASARMYATSTNDPYHR